jgi:hypothetical protein
MGGADLSISAVTMIIRPDCGSMVMVLPVTAVVTVSITVNELGRFPEPR